MYVWELWESEATVGAGLMEYCVKSKNTISISFFPRNKCTFILVCQHGVGFEVFLSLCWSVEFWRRQGLSWDQIMDAKATKT